MRIDSLAGRRPEQLTPPQRLRTALARALVTEPELLILDEPLRSLDPRAREEFWDDLRQVHAEAGVTTLALTDDPDEALALADALAVMDLGRIVQFGTPQELYNRPADVFVARLLGPTNLLQGQVESQSGDGRGEVVVRTPLGRLIGQSTPGRAGTGNARSRSRSGPRPCRRRDDPRRLEPVPGDGRADHLSRRAAPDPRARAGRLAGAISAIQSQSQSIREGQSLTLSVAPEHVVVLPGKFALGNGTRRAGQVEPA